jgi:hypothetical protein
MTALEGGSVDRSIGVLDDVFQDKGVDGGKKRLSSLVNILKKQGIVASATSREPRGRGEWASAIVYSATYPIRILCFYLNSTRV